MHEKRENLSDQGFGRDLYLLESGGPETIKKKEKETSGGKGGGLRRRASSNKLKQKSL